MREDTSPGGGACEAAAVDYRLEPAVPESHHFLVDVTGRFLAITSWGARDAHPDAGLDLLQAGKSQQVREESGLSPITHIRGRIAGMNLV
jgi:hypothetical protein